MKLVKPIRFQLKRTNSKQFIFSLLILFYMIGIPNAYAIAADVSMASDIVPGTVGLTSPIAALETQHIRACISLTVGATGGVRAIVAVPAGGTLYNMNYTLINNVAATVAGAVQAAAADFTNALANAGSHLLLIEGTVINGATAGNVDIQLAQNTSDVLPLVAEAGGFMSVLKY